MAKLKYKNIILNTAKSINLTEYDKDSIVMEVMLNSNNTQKFKIPKPKYLRVEQSGSVNAVNSYNCCTVFGDVALAKAGNSIEIEGYVKEFKSIKDSVTLDKTLKVEKDFGADIRASILHIDGDIDILSVAGISGIRVEVIVDGNCQLVNVGNCCSIKGTVERAEAENNIMCTMGKSAGKTSKEKESAIHEEYMKVFGNIFR